MMSPELPIFGRYFRTLRTKSSYGIFELPKQNPTQTEKFKDLARELECDEDEARWDERLKKVAKGKSEKPE